MAEKRPKGKKKQWYTLLSPSLFDCQPLGKSFAYDANDLMNRTIAVNGMALTGDMKKQSQILTFSVISIKQNQGETFIKRFHVMPPALKRIVRRNRDRVDLCFDAVTKDNVPVRIKPVLITRTLSSRAKRTALRHAVEKEIREHLKHYSFDNCVKDLINGKFQSSLKHAVKNVFALKAVEMKVFERIAQKSTQAAIPEEVSEKVEDTIPEITEEA